MSASQDENKDEASTHSINDAETLQTMWASIKAKLPEAPDLAYEQFRRFFYIGAYLPLSRCQQQGLNGDLAFTMTFFQLLNEADAQMKFMKENPGPILKGET